MRRASVMRFVAVLCGLALAMAACSGSGSDEAGADATPVAGSECTRLAAEIVDRLDGFLEPYATLTPEEFLAQPELDGLTDFQNDVAAILGREVPLDGTACGAGDLQTTLDAALADYAGTSLLADFLVTSIRTDPQRTVRNVLVEPGDDIARILASLETGSSITFGAGTYPIDEAMLVQTGVTLVGAGADATILESTAADAAMAVFGDGDLVMQDLTLRHTGAAPASVLVVFESPVDLLGVRISGAVADADGAGGSGLVLSGEDIVATAGGVPTAAATPLASATAAPGDVADGPVSRIAESELSGNGGAGIVVISGRRPMIVDNRIVDNARCGICYFDDAGGAARRNVVTGNGIGVQAGDRAVAEVSDNELSDNTVAGLVSDADTRLAVLDNAFEGNGEVGIEVQAAAAPEIRGNSFGAHGVGLSIRGTSQAFVRENTFSGGDVAIQISGDARPTVADNTIEDTAIAGVLHTETSRGTFEDNVITITAGAGVSVGGDAAPMHRGTEITGGDVGMAYSENGAGRAVSVVLDGQQVGIAVVDDAAPEVDDADVGDSAAAAVVFRDRAAGKLTGATITDPATIGLQLGGTAEPVIEGATIEGGETGALIIEQTTAELVGNTFDGQGIAIAVGGESNPHIDGNEITAPSNVGVLVQEQATGRIENNTFRDVALVAIRVSGTARPEVMGNAMFAAVVTSDDGADAEAPAAAAVGFLYEDDAAGTVKDNRVFGFAIGVQAGGSSSAEFETNRLDGAGVGGVGFLYDGDSAGTVARNTITAMAIGFQLSGSSSVVVDGNEIVDVTAGAALLQGSTTATLTGNTCQGGALGIVVTEQADPELTDNDCPVASG